VLSSWFPKWFCFLHFHGTSRYIDHKRRLELLFEAKETKKERGIQGEKKWKTQKGGNRKKKREKEELQENDHLRTKWALKNSHLG
jgi:hypothetical protein